MSVSILITLAVVCVVASAISAIFGLAGGMIIFSALTFSVSLTEAIALHAVIQLISNASRIAFSFRHVQWRVAWWFALPTIPAAFIGGVAYSYANPDILEVCIALFIIATIFFPKSLSNAPSSSWWFMFLGFLSSFLGMLVAATGPLIASFFNLNNIRKEALVATKAVCQAFTQVAKMIALSSVVRFDFSAHTDAFISLGIAVVVGAWLGNKLLPYISDASYDRLNNALLLVLALLMIGKIVLKYAGL